MHWITKTNKPYFLDTNQIWCPLLDIKKLNINIPTDLDIVVFTSQNAFVDCKFRQSFVVGQNGIKNVADLKLAMKNISGRHITYFRGRYVTDDLSFLLQNNIFESIILYEANFIEVLPSNLLKLLLDEKIASITINSNRSFESFKKIMIKYNINYQNINLIFDFNLL